MRRLDELTCIAVLAILATMPAISLGQEKSAAEVFDNVFDSIVVIIGVDVDGQPIAQGSGVVLDRTQVITNCHIYSEAFGAVVRYGGNEMAASLLHMDPDRDLCSFTVPNLTASSARTRSTEDLKIGDVVYAIGAPRGLELTLSGGLISGLRPSGDGRFLLQTTAPISPGSSGGGLFDSQGRLIGLTTLLYRDSQQLNFAIPVDWVFELPTRHSEVVVVEASIEYGRKALNKLEENFGQDPLWYRCKREVLLTEIKPVLASLHPAEWAKAAKSAYDEFNPSICPPIDERISVNDQDAGAYLDLQSPPDPQDIRPPDSWICRSGDAGAILELYAYAVGSEGAVSFYGAGVYFATYYVEGLDRRWEFGETLEHLDSRRYSLVMAPSGVTEYFDFLEARNSDDLVQAKDSFDCRIVSDSSQRSR